MSGGCETGCGSEARHAGQAATLRLVLLLNAVMFIVVLGAGIYAGSTALLSDSLDNLGDSLTYGLSLLAVHRAARVKARVAMFKGAFIVLAGLVVLVQVVQKLLVPTVPVFEVMGLVSVAALAANGTCLYLLTRYRTDDVNMSSAWECSRNDIASNISVFVAAGAVWLTQSGWPDVVVGLGLAVLFLRSAMRVLAHAAYVLKSTA